MINFKHESFHHFQGNGIGDFEITPPLANVPGLYIIENNGEFNSRKYYIGTTIQLKKRFDDRIAVLRELSLEQDSTGDKIIHIISIYITGNPNVIINPNREGEIKFRFNNHDYTIDAETLLIATYTRILNLNILNIDKTKKIIVNNNPIVLNWNFVGGPFPGAWQNNFSLPVNDKL
jgi:hypothetical protein